MEIRDWIELSSVIASFILAFLSLIFVVIAIKQNSKMIKNSTRPYVAVYLQAANFQRVNMYLVVKNYGKSAAIIDKMEFSVDLKDVAYGEERIPFDNMEETTIAPNQSIISYIDTKKSKRNGITLFSVDLEYHDNVNVYKEKYPINIEAYMGNVSSRASTKNEELKIISYTLQDLVEKQF